MLPPTPPAKPTIHPGSRRCDPGHDVVMVGAGILELAGAYHILQARRGLAPLAEITVDRRGEQVPVGRGAPGRGAPACGGFKMLGTNAEAGGPDCLRLFLEMKSVAEHW